MQFLNKERWQMNTQDIFSKIRAPKYRGRKCRVCLPKNKCKNRLDCCDKRLFQNKSLAKSAESDYRNNINFSNMNHYPCKFHKNKFHLGHDPFLNEKEILERELWHAQTLLLDNKNHSLVTKQF